MYGSLIPQQQQMSLKNLPDIPVNNSLGNRDLSAQELQVISKYLVELGAASGKIQSGNILLHNNFVFLIYIIWVIG